MIFEEYAYIGRNIAPTGANAPAYRTVCGRSTAKLQYCCKSGRPAMRVGVPKEIKVHEYRVGLTPLSVREYVAAGHAVLIEAGAGAGISADDEAYRRAGAQIAASADEIFATADMVVKVKEPQPSEWKKLRENQILFTYLHLAADPDQAAGLMQSG